MHRYLISLAVAAITLTACSDEQSPPASEHSFDAEAVREVIIGGSGLPDDAPVDEDVERVRVVCQDLDDAEFEARVSEALSEDDSWSLWIVTGCPDRAIPVIDSL